MFRVLILMGGLFAFLVLLPLVSAKFAEGEYNKWEATLSDVVKSEFEPDGDKILEVCWIEGQVVGNGTIFGRLSDCVPNHWSCVLDHTKLLSSELKNIACKHMKNTFGPVEHVCSYRGIANRNPCEHGKHARCHYVMLACEKNEEDEPDNSFSVFGTVILILIPFLLVLACFGYAHYRVRRSRTINFKPIFPSPEPVAMIRAQPIVKKTETNRVPEQVGKVPENNGGAYENPFPTDCEN